MNELKITYKGVDLVDADISTAVEKTLKTAGKYMEADVVINAEGGSGGGTVPDVGFVPETWDSEGYVLSGTWYGDTMPAYAFAKYSATSDGDALNEKLESVEVDGALVIIPAYAFENCKTLSTISIPDTVENIQMYAFQRCSALDITEFHEGLLQLGNYAFEQAFSGGALTLPESLIYIGNYALRNTGLESIRIKGKLSSLGSYSLQNNARLESVYIEQKPSATLNSSQFSGCANLTDIYVSWSEGEVRNAPWGATNATIHYNYVPS